MTTDLDALGALAKAAIAEAQEVDGREPTPWTEAIGVPLDAEEAFMSAASPEVVLDLIALARAGLARTDTAPVRDLLAAAIHENWHTTTFPDDGGTCDCPDTEWIGEQATDILATPSGQRLARTGEAEALRAALVDIQTMAEADYGDDPLADRMKALLVLIPMKVEAALAAPDAEVADGE